MKTENSGLPTRRTSHGWHFVSAVVVLLLLCCIADAKPYVAPLPGYQAAVNARLQAAWTRAIQPHIHQRNTGTAVNVRCEITPEGKVENARIRFNSGGRKTEGIALRVIHTTSLPPMPPKVRQVLANRSLVQDFEFIVFDWYHGPFYRRGR